MSRITQASLFSDLIVAEGKLLANGQDAKLYCLDPQTGNILWTQRSSGIGSSLHYQDGVVYYIASQNLLATEVATGKLLWNLPCPDAYTEKRADSWFSGFVTGLPARSGRKGRVFASTNLNVYCFEAAK
jgi:outer membrane protein assembly factor BamB